MIKIFNGKWRGPKGTTDGFGMILDFRFREMLSLFKNAKLAVFMAIALHADEDGVCFPSYDTLERETGYSRATIAAALEDLCKTEIKNVPVLARYRVRDEAGRYTGSNRYLVFPTIKELQSLEMPTLDKSTGGESKLKDKPVLKEEPKIKDQPLRDDELFSKVIKAWESIRGGITAFDAQYLGEMVDDWEGHRGGLPAGHPNLRIDAYSAVTEALRVMATTANNPNLKYTEKVLQGWMRDGYQNNGKRPEKKSPQPQEVY